MTPEELEHIIRGGRVDKGQWLIQCDGEVIFIRLALQVSIHPLEDGPGYLAICSSLQGCHAQGATVGSALDSLQAVARTLLQLRKEDGLPLPDGVEPPDGAMDGRLAVNVS